MEAAARAESKRRRQGQAPCLPEETVHVHTLNQDFFGNAGHHKYLSGQIVPAMRTVAISRFRYSAPLVPWTDAELDKLHVKWLERAAWKLPPGYPSAPLAFPSTRCAEMYLVVPMVQARALAKHVKQLFSLPEELRETAIRKYKRLCVTAVVATMSANWQQGIALVVNSRELETQSGLAQQRHRPHWTGFRSVSAVFRG